MITIIITMITIKLMAITLIVNCLDNKFNNYNLCLNNKILYLCKNNINNNNININNININNKKINNININNMNINNNKIK